MEDRRIDITQQDGNETDILGHIVDAMLAAEEDLRDATMEEWSQTLVESCRRRKRLFGDQRISLASTC
jgi:hypothetical protein